MTPGEKVLLQKAVITGMATLFLVIMVGATCILFAKNQVTAGIITALAGLSVWSSALTVHLGRKD